jgi:hypothetical protein
MSNGLPPPVEPPGSAAGGGAVVLVELEDEVLVGGEDWMNVGGGVLEGGVGGALEVDVDDTSGSSVSVSVADGAGGRTVVNVSGALLLEVRGGVMTVLVRLLLLLLGIGVSGEVPGQSSSTRLPNSACPSTDISGTSAELQTPSSLDSIRSRPRIHPAEHLLPATKSLIEQLGISAL